MSFPDGVRYEITNGFPWLEFFDDENPNENGEPFIRQHIKPDGTDWSSVEEVEVYAQGCITEWNNPPSTTISPEVAQALMDAGWSPPEN